MKQARQDISDTVLAGSDEMKGMYLTFYTDGQLFGVPIADVVQIVGMQEITEIPEFPSYAKGIINLRGSIIPVIDVRARLSKPEAAYNERTCIIVTSIRDGHFGFIVDEVDEVTSIAEEFISPPPAQGTDGDSFVTGVARLETRGKIVLTIDTAKMLGERDFAALNAQIEY